ncbi:helix-turn-helix domain-containing protein [Lacticaseibacillus daqingensis]|uniref:helix-turn-helix domain-containing protein n=1 Tax=Lacticaseibacillus daqingensis TaxID=2486014 RepID=UPI000F7984F0|nr:RodZ domain-containing protein [Lacticaseibacillus daqingensis]
MDEIGQKLRSARIEKGYTLDDLQQITKIQKRYLIAIEEGRFDALPGDFYVRAFIKQYAETVGLDSDALLTQFQQDIPETQPQEYVEQSVENKTRVTRAAENSPVNKLKSHAFQIALVGLAILLVGAIYFVTWKNSQGPKQPISTDTSSVAVSETKDSSTTSSKSSSSKKAASSSKKKASSSTSKKAAALEVTVATSNTTLQTATLKNLPASGNKVTLTAGDSAAWVAVILNNATAWQGTLSAGESHTYELPDGATAFSVKSGNMPQTGITINDTKVDATNGTRIVRTIQFTAATDSESTGD